MKIALNVLGVLVAFVALLATVITLAGSTLPKTHEASRSVFLQRDPQAVYGVIRDFEAGAGWRSGVERIELLEPSNGHARFREYGPDGPVTYQVVKDVPGRTLVTAIADRDLPWSGSWTYTLEPERGGTRLTITENGTVSNVFFRFMSRYVFGHTKSIETYLAALEIRMGRST